MCTVTWLHSDAGYHLFFNRDEQISRLPALPPTIHEVSGVRCIYPVDSQAGGTWLGVNEHGITIGILNHYAAATLPTATEPRTSRGLLVTSLLDARYASDVDQRLSGSGLKPYAPFILIVISPRRNLKTHTWDGSRLTFRHPVVPPFLTTSGFDSDRVAAVRARSYESWTKRYPTLDASSLQALHASRLPEPGSDAICMQRDDAKTLSLSRVTVQADRASFFYADGPPNTTPLAAPIELPRSQA